jgi:hypothetical protein
VVAGVFLLCRSSLRPRGSRGLAVLLLAAAAADAAFVVWVRRDSKKEQE